jgi:hypothetical protein
MMMLEESGSAPKVRHFRYDATGLRGQRMRLMDDTPTSDAGHVQEALIGVTDVICVDDTPNVMHDLTVHPVGQPEIVGRVEFRQLALYDDPQ